VLTRCPALCIAVLSLCLHGCVSEIAADATAQFLAEASPGARAHFDYETAGAAAANGIVQLEGLHRVSPGNDQLTLLLAQAYVVYAFGWVMDTQEAALLARDYERADREKFRAYLMYSRAEQLIHRLFRNRDAGIDKVVHEDPDKLLAYLRDEYNDKEDDVEWVLWWAIAWGSTITNSPEFDALIDLPAAKTLARHAVELDERYESAGALALLGGFECSYPEQLGGDWKKGRAYFERAIELSDRHSHLHLINFARTYAINAQDKTLFLALINEVIESGDQGDAYRLSNKVARRRAERYLAHVDEWFE
jgi:hypothetical protein